MKSKAQDEDMGLKGPNVGNKRMESTEDLSEVEGRVQKKVRRGESCNNNSDSLNETVVTAKQHCQGNEGLRMELPKAGESSISSSVAQPCATMGSRFCFHIRNKVDIEEHGEEEGECWFY